MKNRTRGPVLWKQFDISRKFNLSGSDGWLSSALPTKLEFTACTAIQTYSISALTTQHMDMVYVDRGRDERTFRSDTENAFRMLSRNRPAVIAWDDYGNPLSPAVKEYLDTRCENLIFVEESLTVFHLSGVSVDID